MGNYIFYLKNESKVSREGETNSPKDISEFIRDKDGLCIGGELHGSRFFREFAFT